MNNSVLRISLAAAIVSAVLLTPSSQTQTDKNPGPAAPFQESTAAQSQPQSNAQTPSANDTQTEDAHSFTGRVAKENGQLVLKDLITKVNYHFDDQAKARRYVGKQVKVTGKLDLDSNTIHIESIEPVS